MSVTELLSTTTEEVNISDSTEVPPNASEPPDPGWYLICPSYGKINHVYFQVSAP